MLEQPSTRDPVRTATEQECAPDDALSSLKSQLREAQKLAGLGTVAAMVAHEYNNVLAPVISYAQYALDHDDVPLMRKTLGMVLKQFDAVRAMSDRLLGMARPDEGPPGRVPLLPLIKDALVCLGRDPTKDGIRLIIEVDEHIAVLGHPNHLQQVFFNLFLNARHAMRDKRGTLKISATPLSETMLTVHVRDTGCGISPDNLARIFDPFFTTRGEARKSARGIGLGLAVCREIIREHGGDISVESMEGRGTSFSLTLRLAGDDIGNR